MLNYSYKKFFVILSICVLGGLLTIACDLGQNENTDDVKITIDKSLTLVEKSYEENLDASIDVEESVKEVEKEESVMLNIQIGEHVLEASLENNTSADALVSLLKEGPVVIKMRDYAGMEKVGSFPEKLVTNDVAIKAVAGDLILYQGKQFVIYYDDNSWTFTKLGKILNTNQSDLMEILGKGDVEVTLSLTD